MTDVLGKGLASLIPDKKNQRPEQESQISRPLAGSAHKTQATSRDVSSQQVALVPVERIVANPLQPRRDFNKDGLEELARSIIEHGIIQPLLVTKRDDHFELVAGERRLRAARMAGVREVPVIVRQIDDKRKLAMAIVENIQRSDLNALEEAEAFRKMADDFNLTQDEIAEKVGKSRSQVSNILRLLDLPTEVQKSLRSEEITEGHARAVLSARSKQKQLLILKEIVAKQLNVRQVESLAKSVNVSGHIRQVVSRDSYVDSLEKRLQEIFGTKVKIRLKGEGGELIVEFYSRDELGGIYSRLSGSED